MSAMDINLKMYFALHRVRFNVGMSRTEKWDRERASINVEVEKERIARQRLSNIPLAHPR
jgi:hypothetical protein